MPTIEIRHRWTNGVVFSGEYPDLKAAVEAAVAAGTNLVGANLDGVSLVGASLVEANLDGVIWRKGVVLRRCPLQLLGLDYPVTILDDHMEIGCQFHTIADWRGFDNDAIARMDGRRARKFWDAHGPALLALAASDGRGVEAEKPADVNV